MSAVGRCRVESVNSTRLAAVIVMIDEVADQRSSGKLESRLEAELRPRPYRAPGPSTGLTAPEDVSPPLLTPRKPLIVDAALVLRECIALIVEALLDRSDEESALSCTEPSSDGLRGT